MLRIPASKLENWELFIFIFNDSKDYYSTYKVYCLPRNLRYNEGADSTRSTAFVQVPALVMS